MDGPTDENAQWNEQNGVLVLFFFWFIVLYSGEVLLMDENNGRLQNCKQMFIDTITLLQKTWNACHYIGSLSLVRLVPNQSIMI